jgi:hypothetical protein
MPLLDKPGLIAVPCRPDNARHVLFYQHMMILDRPAGSKMQLFPGFFAHLNRNKAVRQALAEDLAWVFFVDDDQLLMPDALMRVLAHDRDIVTVNLLYKDHPFAPFLFFDTNEHGAGHIETLEQQRGLLDVKACGLGGVLVKTDVFRHLPEPWFDVDEHLKTDDFYFCRAATRAGYTIQCDLEVRSGHLALTQVWPEWDEDAQTWRTAVIIGSGVQINIPAAVKTPHYREWIANRRKAG